MGSLGWPEIMAILVIALIIFGPRKLPQLGRTLGKALGEFRRATNDLKNTLELEVHKEEEKNNAGERRKREDEYSRRQPADTPTLPDEAPAPEPPVADEGADLETDAGDAPDAEQPSTASEAAEKSSTHDADQQ